MFYQTRSQLMATIRSRGNKGTEGVLLQMLRASRITGWRRHYLVRVGDGRRKVFKVRPDFVFSKHRLAVFVDGCFWHGCPYHGRRPRENIAFWEQKFAANRLRDRTVTRSLRQNGWTVLRIWEHELTSNPERCVQKISTALKVVGSKTNVTTSRLLQSGEMRLKFSNGQFQDQNHVCPARQ